MLYLRDRAEKRMNILFLDIDGVLNSIPYFKSIKGILTREKNEIDETKMQLLKQIVDENNCSIVLSSSWRTSRNSSEPAEVECWNYLVEMFRKYELEIMDITPVIDNIRPLEIQTWLETQKREEPVCWISIEDDWDDEVYSEYGMEGHLIETKLFGETPDSAGLLSEHIEMARELFRKQICINKSHRVTR